MKFSPGLVWSCWSNRHARHGSLEAEVTAMDIAHEDVASVGCVDPEALPRQG